MKKIEQNKIMCSKWFQSLRNLICKEIEELEEAVPRDVQAYLALFWTLPLGSARAVVACRVGVPERASDSEVCD